MREASGPVKAGRSLSSKPRRQVSAAETNVLSLSHGRKLATPDRLVDVPACEAQLGSDLGHGQEVVPAGAVGFALDRPRRAHHLRPEGRPDVLERAEQGGDLVGAELRRALRIAEHLGEIRGSAGVHRQPLWTREEPAPSLPALPRSVRSIQVASIACSTDGAISSRHPLCAGRI
jgi:hypothetical protein